MIIEHSSSDSYVGFPLSLRAQHFTLSLLPYATLTPPPQTRTQTPPRHPQRVLLKVFRRGTPG